MNRVISLLLLVVLSSCVEVGFKHPMPSKGKTLETIPPKIIAYYTEQGSDSGENGGNKLNINDLNSDIDVNAPLSDNTILKLWKGNYFLNQKEDSLWHIIMVKPGPNNSFEAYQLDGGNEETLAKLKRITKVKEIRSDDGELDLVILDPTFQEFKKIVKSGAFERIDVFQD